MMIQMQGNTCKPTCVGCDELEKLECKFDERLREHETRINNITVQLAGINTKLNIVLGGLGVVMTTIIGVVVEMWF